MMETVALILAGTAGVFVLLIIAVNIYFKIRPNFRIRVNCWFCQESTHVPYDDRNSWNCHFCEQYNGFSADGGYNKPIAAQHDESLNKTVTARRGAKQQTVDAGNGLCQRCNANQELKVRQLASFAPVDPRRHDDELEAFRERLERYYRLCPACEEVLGARLAKQASWITGLRLDRLRRSALLHKDQLAGRLSRLRATGAQGLRCATTALAAWLLASHYLSVAPPVALAHLLAATVAWETHLTAGGTVLQLLAGVYQARHGGRWAVVDALSVIAWAALHGLGWATTLGQLNVWVSPVNLDLIHMCTALSVVLACIAADFKTRPKTTASKTTSKTWASKTTASKTVVDKRPRPVPPSHGPELPEGEELKATTPANCRREDSPVSTPKPSPKNVDATPHSRYEDFSGSSDSFKTFRSVREASSVPRDLGRVPRDPYKTRSRVAQSKAAPRRSPSDVSAMLDGSLGNVSLPVRTSTPEEDRLPEDIGDGIGNLTLGSPEVRRRCVLNPSRFGPRTDVARSPWVAGGFWHADPKPPLSQSSSQSSGFASQSSQMMPDSRSSSVCGGDYEVPDCRLPTPEDGAKGGGFDTTLLYNAGGCYPASVSSESNFPAMNKTVAFHDGRTCFYHPPPLFTPQPYCYLPPQYLYNARFCYPQQMSTPFTFGQARGSQLCISAPGSPGSSCSDVSQAATPTTLRTRLARHGMAAVNVLVVLALVCSLYYNALHSGVLAFTPPG